MGVSSTRDDLLMTILARKVRAIDLASHWIIKRLMD